MQSPGADPWSRVKKVALPVVIRALRRLPYSVAETLLVGLSLAQAMSSPARLRRARSWAMARGSGNRAGWAVVGRLFVHRGRELAAWPQAAILAPEALRRRLRFEGLHHLESARQAGGVILLSFHLGMPAIGTLFRLAGYHVTALTEEDHLGWPAPPPEWDAALSGQGRSITWMRSSPQSKTDALYRLRQVVLSGGTVALAADSGQGRVLCHVCLPGRPLSLREGWFALRRWTRAATLPVLAHREGGHWIVEIHPPLPVLDDEARNREICQQTLAELLHGYVSRFPEQCLHLALGIDA